jgi:acyl-CoA reductase-like NAD-dependent aldehyde dehydrogenase
VVAAIVPWNSPLLLLCWKLAPALAAHPDVDKVAFTGSTAVGAEVAKAAAANITGVLLELGGKSAHLVFDDADLDAARNGVLAGVFAATGQTCMAGSRLLVARGVHDALVGRIAERARSIRLGDPKAGRDRDGPGGDRAAVPQGAVVPGRRSRRGRHRGRGRPARRAAGRVLRPAHRADRGQADHDRGLRGGVRPGAVWINAYRVVGPDVPFGGFGQSGLGRENGIDAVHEYTQTKAVWVVPAPGLTLMIV